MSYRCDKCNAVRMGAELKYIAEVRDVIYNRVFVRFDRKLNKEITRNDCSFNGVEIVTEERLCDNCYEQFKDNPPKVGNKPKYVDFVGEKRRPKYSSDKQDNEELDLRGLKEKFEGRS